MKKSANIITAVIVDDEKEACDRLNFILDKIIGMKVVAEETDASIATEQIIKYSPDIVFIDVEMPGKSGFDIIKEVRESDLNPTFIFVTGYNQYAIKAIKNAAFDYLLKPVDFDELKAAINRYSEVQKNKYVLQLPSTLKTKYQLTDREIEIIEYLIKGYTSKEISEILFLSKHTIDTHRRNILEKTKVNTTTALNYLIQHMKI